MLDFYSIRLLHFNLKCCTRDIRASLNADLNYHSQGLRQSGFLGSWEPIDCVTKKLGNLMTENPPIKITDEVPDSFTFFLLILAYNQIILILDHSCFSLF